MSGTYVEYDPELAALNHETKSECDRRDNDGYTPGVGDLVNICRDTSKNPTSWYVDRLWIGGAVLLMPFKNGVPGWWWRTTHLGIHRSHLVLVKAASQEALF